MSKKLLLFLTFILFVLSACSSPQTTEDPVPTQEITIAEEPTEEPVVEATPTVVPTAEGEAYPAPIPPTVAAYPPPTDGGAPANPGGSGYPAPIFLADPQAITLEAEDGTQLTGTYYAPVYENAPVIVLMHQFGSDQTQWTDIALWLQSGLPGNAEWLPPFPEGLRFAVLTFDFRGHGGSEGSRSDDAGLLMDAQAAVLAAKAQPGVDPLRVLTIGTSIGADGAMDACVTLENGQVADTQESVGCLGVMSISPDSYLGVNYTNAGNAFLGDPLFGQVYCIAAENDGGSPTACNSLSGNRLSVIIYPGSAHGKDLLVSGLDPDIGTLILEFVTSSLELRQ